MEHNLRLSPGRNSTHLKVIEKELLVQKLRARQKETLHLELDIDQFNQSKLR
jgi:hypothetical protein